MAFLGKVFFIYFYLFSQSATLPVYLFVSLFVILHFLSYYFSALNIFQGVCLNFARTLGRAVVVEWFKGNSDVTRAVYFGKQSLSQLCFEAASLSNKIKGVISHGQNWT